LKRKYYKLGIDLLLNRMAKNDKLKVLLISPSPPPVGGIQSWTINLINHFKHQDQIELFYEDTAVKYRGVLELNIWNRITAGIRVTKDVIRAMKQLIRIHNPDVIHLTSSASLALLKDYLIIREAKKFHVPVIIHWHFGRIPELAIKKNWEWYLISFLIQRASYSVVIDNHSYKSLCDAGYKNVVNIPNPVSEELVKIANNQKIFERKGEEGKVVFVGHVYVNKGIYELVEACVALPVVKQLKIIGPIMNEVQPELEKIASKREDGSWLVLTGAKSSKEVFAEIRSAELLVLPSYTEGFPIVILEAMAMGCPVVATNVGAISDMLNINSDLPAGICIPVKDIEALKVSIKKLLSDKELNTKYGQNGLTRVLENFTADKIYKEYQEVWQTLASNI